MSPNNPTPEVPEESKDRFKVAIKCMFVEYTSQVGLSEAFNYAMAIAAGVQEDIKSVQAAPKVEAERQADTKTSGHLVNNTAGITPRKLRNYDVKSYISHASGAVAGEDVAEIEKLQKKIESLKRKKLDEASEEGKKRRRSSGFYGMKLA